MRSSIEFYVSGETVSEVRQKALTEWRRLNEDVDMTLPQATEVRMVSSSEDEKKYMAYVVIKTKIED